VGRDRAHGGLLGGAQTMGDARAGAALDRMGMDGEPVDGGDGERFVTALALEITDSETVRMIDCGHVPPLVIRDGEVVEMPIDDPGLPLGLRGLLDEGQRAQEIRLPPGSRVLAFTDGVSEARGPDGEFYPLIDRLRRWCDLPTAQMLRELRTDLEEYAQGALVDDAAALVVQR
jgi:serine phosphatase RsbU (regulator of sigma subunit)